MKQHENEIEVLTEKRSDILNLDPRVITVEEGFNVREDFGDLEELAISIAENGVRNNLRGYKKDGVYYLTDGHRRLKAALMLIERGMAIRVPFMSEKAPSAEKRIIDMYICNDGKKLTPLEESALMVRLKNCGLSVKEISNKLGCTETHVYNMLILSDVPARLKNRIKGNEISATLVMNIVKGNKELTDDQLTDKIENALEKAKATGKKVTKKDMDKELKTVNSISELRTAMKLIDPAHARNKKLHEFATALLNNELTADAIIEMMGAKVHETA